MHPGYCDKKKDPDQLTHDPTAKVTSIIVPPISEQTMQVEAGEEASWLAQRLKACRTHWKTMFTANTSKKNQSVDGQHAGGGLLEACVCSFHLCAERAGGSKKNFGVLFSVSRCAGLYRETILDSNEKERAEKSCAMMPACRCSPASSPSAPLSLSRAALLTWKLEGLDCRNLAFGPGPLKNYHYLHKRAPLSAFAPLMICRPRQLVLLFPRTPKAPH